MQTAIYPSIGENPVYPALGLAGEAGECANQIKKVLRDDQGQLTEDRVEKLVDELGDVLWYAAALAAELGADLEAIASRNLRKLKARQLKGTLKGSGER